MKQAITCIHCSLYGRLYGKGRTFPTVKAVFVLYRAGIAAALPAYRLRNPPMIRTWNALRRRRSGDYGRATPTLRGISARFIGCYIR